MNFLKAEATLFQTAPDGTLRVVTDNCCAFNIEIRRAMPLSQANQFLIVRDGEGEEVGVLESIQGLSEESRLLVQKELDNRYFLPQITKIYSIFEKFGSAQWDVETNRGRTEISSKALHESLIELSPTRFILRDVEENRFEIPDVTKLDAESRKRFSGQG